MFKKNIKLVMSISFISLIIGAILLAIGLLSGGVNRLREATKPSLISQSFKQVDTIGLALHSKEVKIEPSPDDQFHLHYWDLTRTEAPMTVNFEQGKQLNLVQYYADAQISLVQFLGESLNLSQNSDYHVVTIQVPKGKTLKKVYGQVGGRPVFGPGHHDFDEAQALHITGQTIENLTIQASIHLNQSTIKGGKLSLESLPSRVTESKLSNITTVGAWSDDDFYDNTVPYPYNLFLEKTSLENVQLMEGLNYLQASDLTLSKDVNISSRYADIAIQLTPDSLAKTNIKAQFQIEQGTNKVGEASFEEEEQEEPSNHLTGQAQFTLSDSIKKGAKTHTDTQFIREVKEAQATLTIDNQGTGHIQIN